MLFFHVNKSDTFIQIVSLYFGENISIKFYKKSRVNVEEQKGRKSYERMSVTLLMTNLSTLSDQHPHLSPIEPKSKTISQSTEVANIFQVYVVLHCCRRWTMSLTISLLFMLILKMVNATSRFWNILFFLFFCVI